MAKKTILIIGGGIAGMSAGIYAQKNGFQANILEMHDKPGGQLTAWDREGYRFDYCLHWLVGSASGVYNDIWWETGAINEHVEVINHRIYTKLVDPQEGEFFIYNDLDEWEQYLIDFAPEDEKGIRKMIRILRKGNRLDNFEDAPGMRSIFDYFNALIESGSFFPTLLKYRNKSAKEFLDQMGFQNEKLGFFFQQLFGGNEFSAIAFILMFGWFNAQNAGYLEGGSLKMAARMAKKFKELGGKFSFRTRVKEILLESEEEGSRAVGVLLENGEQLKADHIISACDGKTVLFDMLKGKYLSEKHKTAYKEWKLFTPLVMVSFGINGKISTDSHNVNYLNQGQQIGRTKVDNYFLMNRSVYDSSFAAPGKSVLLLQFESPWENWEELDGEAYQEEKRKIEEKCLKILESLYPGIQDKIEVIDVATPKTTVRFTGVWKGAYEGFIPNQDVLNGLPMTLEGLNDFTMIGQWLFPGGGLPPSAQSGKWAIQMLCKEEGKEFHTKRLNVPT